MKYNVIILFMIYSYMGATYENLKYFIARHVHKNQRPKMVVNPIAIGFPLYGIGAFTIIKLSEHFGIKSFAGRFLLSGLICSTYEYLTGVWLKVGEGAQDGPIHSWDYRSYPFNIGGKVSLFNFIAWGILGSILLNVNPHIMSKIEQIKF